MTYFPPPGYRLPAKQNGTAYGSLLPAMIGKSRALLPGPAPVAPGFLRDVSTRVSFPSTVTANALPYNSWSGQVARCPISAIKVVWCNWAADSGETSNSGTLTIRASIEFPVGSGINTQLTFGGTPSIVVASGQEGVTDLVTLPTTIPAMSGSPNLTFNVAAKTISRDSGSWFTDGFGLGQTVAVDGAIASAGANNGAWGAITGINSGTLTFASAAGRVNEAVTAVVGGHYRIKQWQQSSVAIPYSAFGPVISVGFGDIGLQSATDYTMQTTMPVGSAPNVVPARIMGLTTTNNGLCLLEDSRGVGASDVDDDSHNRGQLARSLAARHPLFRMGNAGVQAAFWPSNNTKQLRVAALSPPPAIAIVLGVNDLGAGRTAAQIEGYLTGIAALFPTSQIYVGTIAPKTTSVDGWATLVGQTVTFAEAQKVLLNTWIRALNIGVIPNFAGFLDVANYQESSLNSGFWKVTGGTGAAADCADGLHATSLGYKLVSVSVP